MGESRSRPSWSIPPLRRGIAGSSWASRSTSAAANRKTSLLRVRLPEAPYLSRKARGEIARELLGLVNDPGNRAYMEFYRDRSTALEKEITYIVAGEERTARVMGVDD